MKQINLVINFFDGEKENRRTIMNVNYIPNIGEYVDNLEDKNNFYTVIKKSVYYSELQTDIIIKAVKKIE